MTDSSNFQMLFETWSFGTNISPTSLIQPLKSYDSPKSPNWDKCLLTLRGRYCVINTKWRSLVSFRCFSRLGALERIPPQPPWLKPLKSYDSRKSPNWDKCLLTLQGRSCVIYTKWRSLVSFRCFSSFSTPKWKNYRMQQEKNIHVTRVMVALALLGHQILHSQNKFFSPSEHKYLFSAIWPWISFYWPLWANKSIFWPSSGKQSCATRE